MVTAVAEQDVQLSWDAFLPKETPRNVRQHIDRFRESEWPNIKRQLGQVFHLEIPDGLEPHWVDPGRAILWQQEVVRHRKATTDSDGRQRFVAEEVAGAWKPIGKGVAFNNASIIASYLNKGLRLRPPVQGVDAVALEAAAPSIVPHTPVIPVRKFVCRRHGEGTHEYTTWKAYARHCIASMETMEEKPPEEVLKTMTQFKFFCAIHMQGFNSVKAARQHITWELKRPGRSLHPTLKDMEVSQ